MFRRKPTVYKFGLQDESQESNTTTPAPNSAASPKILTKTLKAALLLLLADILFSAAPFVLALFDEGFLMMVWFYIITGPLALALLVFIIVVFVINVIRKIFYAAR